MLLVQTFLVYAVHVRGYQKNLAECNKFFGSRKPVGMFLALYGLLFDETFDVQIKLEHVSIRLWKTFLYTNEGTFTSEGLPENFN